MREFGSGSNALTVYLAQGNGPSRYDGVLTGTAIPKLPNRFPLELRVMPQAISQTIEVDSAGIPKQAGRFVRWFDADAAFLRSVEASQQVTLSGGSDFAVTISLIGVKGAITALRNCQDELLRSWGVDTEALTKLRDLPKPDNDAQGENPGAVLAQRVDLPRQRILPGSWVSYNDYPSEALRREISGTVVMALSLNPSGRVENCRVVVSSKADCS